MQKHLSRVYNGKLDIGLPTGGTRDDAEVFELTLYDESSGAMLIEFAISPADLALAMNGRAQRNVTFTYNKHINALVGSKAETKTVEVPFEPYRHHLEDVESKRGTKPAKPFEDAVAPYEVDGWRARLSDLQNGHRSVRRGVQNVTFYRNVSADGKPVIL